MFNADDDDDDDDGGDDDGDGGGNDNGDGIDWTINESLETIGAAANPRRNATGSVTSTLTAQILGASATAAAAVTAAAASRRTAEAVNAPTLGTVNETGVGDGGDGIADIDAQASMRIDNLRQHDSAHTGNAIATPSSPSMALFDVSVIGGCGYGMAGEGAKGK
jgi:hypothetical protein